MRLPFVSRAVYEDAIERAVAAEAKAERQTERYHSVCERLVEMKKEGFVSRPKVEPLKPAESVIPAEVEFAIEQRAGGDPFYRRYLTNFSQSELAKGTATENILHRIRYGDDDEE